MFRFGADCADGVDGVDGVEVDGVEKVTWPR